jgi:hypothetical protein
MTAAPDPPGVRMKQPNVVPPSRRFSSSVGILPVTQGDRHFFLPGCVTGPGLMLRATRRPLS